MSNRLTFSLASLILIFVAGFVLLTPGTADAAPPTWDGNATSDQAWTVDTAINVQLRSATDTDNDTITYSISPALPEGISFNAATRTLIGVPTKGAKTKEYTYTATAAGDSITDKFNIAVSSNPKFDPATKLVLYVKVGTNRVIQFPTAMDEDGDPLTYAISNGTIPDGMTFVASLKQLLGAPTTAATEVVLTWTATDDDDNNANLMVGVTVEADNTPVIGGAISDISGVVGTAIGNVQLPTATAASMNHLLKTDDDGNEYEAITYSLDPSLPAGLKLDEIVSGVWILSGTPTAAKAETEYTWTATDPDGDKGTKKFKITVNATSTTPPPTGAPAKPTAAPTVPAALTGLNIALSWTAHTDTTVTGYEVKIYKGDTAAAATAATTPVATIAPASITGTSHTYMTMEADRGKYFAFTVAGVNTSGTGAHSDKSAPVMVPMSSVANNDPAFDAGASIADIDIWKGQDYISGALPIALDNIGDTVTHTFDPKLPAGFAHVQQANTSYIKVTGTATAPASVAALKDEKVDYVATDSAGATAKISFKITLKAPIAPTASPSDDADTFMVSEKGLADWQSNWVSGRVLRNGVWVNGMVPTPRAVNTNEVELDWEAPSADPMADYGAKIDKYKVYQENTSVNPTVTVTYEVGADKTAFTTPPLDNGTYHFSVSAINSVGESKRKEPSHGTITICSTPGVPGDLRAAVDQNADSVTLDWNVPGTTGGCAITGYVVYQTDEDNNNVPYFHQNTTTNFRTPSLSTGQYVFRVAAVNDDDVSGQSAGTAFATIVSVDEPPVFEVTNIDDITIMGGDTLSPVITLPKATDPEGENVSYSVTPSLPSGLIFNRASSVRSISGTAVNVAADTTTHHTYTASDGSKTAALTFSVTVKAVLPSTALIDSTISLPVMSIPPNGFVVLQRNMKDSGIYTQVNGVVVGLANLDHLFRDRGGMALRGPGTAKDLVFSEIMWGSDSSLADDTHSQWIELYNTTKGELKLSNYTLEFYSARIPGTPGAIDEINASAWGDIHGQRGRTSGVDTQGRYAQPVEIISMYRKINYSQVHYHDKREDQLKAVPGGSGHGSWAASTRPSLNIAATWRLATPGSQPRYTIHGASSVPRNVIISEIGNSATDAYDWFELYNTTDAEINLKKYQLSRVTKDGEKGKEVALLKFPDNDNIKIPAKSYLVIAASDPNSDGNDLAAGINITKSAIDQSPRGLGERGNSTVANYAVLSFSLPNDATKALLILRNGHGNEGKAAGFVDVIGTLSIKLQASVPSDWTGHDKNNTVYYNTSLWPLHATGGPHGNVIDGTDDEDFRAGKVYQRNNFGGGTGEKHLATRGYTGIGYDRHASVNAENGGTPGYSKDAVKGDKSNWAGQVTISEIMLATEEGAGATRVPRATRLPQWFEIYNASMTEAASLNNWYLEIQNAAEDFKGHLHATLRLPNVVVQPNQTVMVVSGSGLNSGNFPEQRTINLFTNGTYRRELGITTRGEPVLNPKGFYIQLRDHKNNHVDEVGNLGLSHITGHAGIGRRYTTVTEWQVTSLHSPEGHRASLIRKYDAGIVSKGLEKTGWTLASMTSFRNVPSLTYYGNHRDFGTPGYRGGGPLPVSLSKFRPERLESGEVVIRWITQSELNNAGFNILRSDTRAGEFTKVNTQLILGQGTTSEKTTYEWKDTTAKPNVVYYYQIQDVSLDGQVTTLKISRLKGNVTAAGKATTTWGKLKALQ